jgi:hypothetical protein
MKTLPAIGKQIHAKSLVHMRDIELSTPVEWHNPKWQSDTLKKKFNNKKKKEVEIYASLSQKRKGIRR